MKFSRRPYSIVSSDVEYHSLTYLAAKTSTTNRFFYSRYKFRVNGTYGTLKDGQTEKKKKKLRG